MASAAAAAREIAMGTDVVQVATLAPPPRGEDPRERWRFPFVLRRDDAVVLMEVGAGADAKRRTAYRDCFTDA
jgi:hypothetical protein